MKITNLIAALTVSGGLAFGVAVQANEENEQQVQLKDLPEAVQKTIKDKAGSQEINRVEKETRHGKVVYEAIVNKDGKEWAITVDENGKYVNQHSESKEHHEKGQKSEKY
jgi:uncharacterized membrane protein YkoI